MSDFDLDVLVNAVTQELMRRLNGGGGVVLVKDGCPKAAVAEGFTATDNCKGAYDFVLLTAEAFKALQNCAECAPGHTPCAETEAAAEAPCPAEPANREGAVINLTEKRLLHERDLRDHNAARGDVVNVSKRAIITALAADYAKGIGAKIVRID